MPPFLPRKRQSPPASHRPNPTKRARLTDALDAEATNNVQSLKRNKTFSLGSDETSSSSSLSDVDSDQFEDVIKAGISRTKAGEEDDDDDDDDDDDEEDEDVEWEDAASAGPEKATPRHVPMANGPIQITLRKDDDNVIDYGTTSKAGSGKKGPSKREKKIRIMTHKLHVQYLLWHNAVRNSWIGDKKVQDILVKQLPPQIIREVEKWRRSSGLAESIDANTYSASKGKKIKRKTKPEHERSQRDWGQPSQRLEAGKPDMSHGDPLIMLMKVLSAYWKKRFAITVPGLRKRGYGTKHGLKQDITSLRLDEHDPEKHGEKISNLAELRRVAEKGQGSRDVGAQLFTALLRGLGIQARLVASLQPSGYGWTKVEQMVPKKNVIVHLSDDDSEDDLPATTSTKSSSTKDKAANRIRSRKSQTISLDTDEEEDVVKEDNSADDESVVDVTPSLPRRQKPKYDRDLIFPIYWTEAVSPITNKILPVSPLVLETPVATSPETLSMFEPRGAKAEKGRQVMAYVIAHSSDGTAKDVTVRYLRKNIWPGKTKGFRLPPEKVPIYDQTGRVKRYGDYDWFKHILSFYIRPHSDRTIVDEIEDSSDLVPQTPERKTEDEGVDTLQSLKTSTEFVLERFLRREEALRPDAEPVRMFVSGKAEKSKEEPIYRRADVERCLTAESWHKEGRRPLLGETPMKMVPVRAVTLTRKREAEEHERQYGEKQMQGLYSRDQTEWIIPEPIKDGIIPKNSYGNMDCFVPSMVPEGAVHVPLKGTVRICKKLDIDYAEAVTGFEFGNKRAVPVCTGVVIAKENEQLLKDAWHEWNMEQQRKEETKMEKLVLDLWRKFVLGLRIRERVQDMYGEDIGIVEDEPTGYTREDAISIKDDEDQAMNGGGFVSEDDNGEMGGGFLLPHEDEPAPMEDLIMEDQQIDIPGTTPATDTMSQKEDAQSDEETSSPDQNDNESDTGSEDEKSEEALNEDKEHQTLKSLPEHKPFSTQKNGNSKYHGHAKPYQISNGVEDQKVREPTTSISESDNATDSSEDDSLASGGSEEEKYTPRPTRTRKAQSTRNNKSVSASASKSQSKTSKTHKASIVARAKAKSKVTVPSKGKKYNTADESTESSTDTPPTTQPRRGRGRPRKSDAPATTETSTKKRSARLLRKESTLVTSPYFEQ